MAPHVVTQIPQWSRPSKAGQLSEEQLKQYFELGYVLLEDVLSLDEIDACQKDIADIVDELAKKLFQAGKVKSSYDDLGFFERLSHLEKDFPGAAILLHKGGILPEAIQKLWTNERLLNIAEQLLGPDVAGHPVWNIRPKCPQLEAAVVPWHQDNAYLDDTVSETHIPTAWIPLLDTDAVNGCLEVIEEGHHTGKLAKHVCCAGGTWYVEVDLDTVRESLEVDVASKRRVIPVRKGSLLLFNNLIPHRSLDNFSDKIRWSLDLRWVSPNVSNGFHGLKESILFKRDGKTLEKINWDDFNALNRNKILDKTPDGEVEDPFDTRIAGPWMGKWEIVHHNRHSTSFQPGQTNYHKN